MSVTNHDPIGVHRDDGLANRREGGVQEAPYESVLEVVGRLSQGHQQRPPRQLYLMCHAYQSRRRWVTSKRTLPDRRVICQKRLSGFGGGASVAVIAGASIVTSSVRILGTK